MKKIVFILLISIVFTSNAQEVIAKIKYEEAETAFNEEDYHTTLKKLDEVDEIIKQTSSKVLYLRIMAQYNIIKPNYLEVEFSKLEEARYNCNFYLIEFESNAPSEKYREVYIISQALKIYPNTLQEFNVQQKKSEAEEERRKSIEVIEKQKAEENFKNFVFYKDFKIGLTLKETYKLYPAFKKNYKYKDEAGFAIAPKANTNKYQPSGLYVRNNIVCGYFINFFSVKADDSQHSLGKKTVTEILDRLNKEFMFSPTETTIENSSKVSDSDFYNKAITYSWFKNDKTISLTFSQSTYLGKNLSSVILNSIDENLSN